MYTEKILDHMSRQLGATRDLFVILYALELELSCARDKKHAIAYIRVSKKHRQIKLKRWNMSMTDEEDALWNELYDTVSNKDWP